MKFNKTFSKSSRKLQQPATPKSCNTWGNNQNFVVQIEESQIHHIQRVNFVKRGQEILFKKLFLNFLVLLKIQIFLNRTSTGTRETFINVSLILKRFFIFCLKLNFEFFGCSNSIKLDKKVEKYVLQPWLWLICIALMSYL